MSGTKAGGLKARETNKSKYGDDYYARQGKKGGSVSHPETRYFALHPEFAKIAGKKGGQISKRGKSNEHKD